MSSLSDIEKHVPSLRYGEVLRPVRDWLVLLAVVALLVLLSAAWNTWTYLEVKSGAAFAPPPSSAPTFDTSAIERAETVIDARAAEAGRYSDEYQFVDPS